MSTITEEALLTTLPPIIPKEFNSNQPPTVRLYPLANYIFGTKEAQPEEDPSVSARLERLKDQYETHGMRRTCEGILVCHEHNHPHVLMLQIANAFFKLPGEYLAPEDDEITGFKRRLSERLAPTNGQSSASENDDWTIGDTLSQWWRPNFETFMYPFIPAHCTRPKECKKLYLIHLPKKKVLSVPKNMKLLAVPIFDLYDNVQRYGPHLAAIPHLLSRYNFEFVDDQDRVVAVTPGGGPYLYAKHIPRPLPQVVAGDNDDDGDEEGSKIEEDAKPGFTKSSDGSVAGKLPLAESDDNKPSEDAGVGAEQSEPENVDVDGNTADTKAEPELAPVDSAHQ